MARLATSEKMMVKSQNMAKEGDSINNVVYVVILLNYMYQESSAVHNCAMHKLTLWKYTFYGPSINQ